MGDLEIWSSILKLQDRVTALEKGGPVVPVPDVRGFEDGDFVELIEAAPYGGPPVGSIGVVVEAASTSPSYQRALWAKWSDGWGNEKNGWSVPLKCLKRA